MAENEEYPNDGPIQLVPVDIIDYDINPDTGEPNVSPDFVTDIEVSLRNFSYWENELDNINEHAKEEHDKINMWHDRQVEKINKRISWHKNSIEAYLKRRNITKGNFVNGTVRTTKGRETVVVNDPDVFKDWVTRSEYRSNFHFLNENVIQTPSKMEIMNCIKKTGEIPDGVDLVTSEDKITIKPSSFKKASPKGKDIDFD